jgi:hypothetical protein
VPAGLGFGSEIRRGRRWVPRWSKETREGVQMYIGIGTLVAIIVIILLIYLLA